MAEGKKSFIAYVDWKETFDNLPDDKAGQLVKHLFAYVSDENPKSDDVLINAVFANIKQTLKRDLRKYENIREKRVLAGKASADKRQQMSTSVDTSEQMNPVSDSVSVSVKEEEIIFNRDFENFRLAYPGVKRGFDTEFKNFQKRHKNWRLILPILLPNLQRQIQDRARIKTGGGFVPEWQHLQTYINQSSWEITYESKKKEEVLAPRGPAYQQAAKDII